MALGTSHHKKTTTKKQKIATTQGQNLIKAQNHVFFFYSLPPKLNVLLTCLFCQPEAGTVLMLKCNCETHPNARVQLCISSRAEPEILNELPLLGDVRQRRDLPLLVYCRRLFQSMCHTHSPSRFSTVGACPAGFYFALRVLNRVRVRTGYYAAHNCTSSCCRLSQ